jgi:uncharacterized protein (DUF2236 family)
VAVTREELERSLERIRRDVSDPRGGIHGPGSMSWEVDKHGVLLLGGGCAALLQLAHPYVAHAIDQHSKTRQDVAGRFQRTFANVFAMTFGDLDHAFASARRVHAVHERIVGTITEDVGRFRRGDTYRANDPEALLWVHATLVDGAIRVHDLLVRPLSIAEKDRYWQEGKRFALLFGIPDAIIPPTWPDFERWWDGMIDSSTLAVGAPAADMARFLLAAPTRLHAPLTRLARIATTALLPPRFREEFGLSFGAADRAVWTASVRALRPVLRTLPPRLRYFPAYVEARRRAAGRPTRDRVGRALELIALRGLRRRSTPTAA